MLVADAFTGNFAYRNGEDVRREEWSRQQRCLLPLRPPGGWSATGQPCDGVHHLFRRLINWYMDGQLGAGAAPFS